MGGMGSGRHYHWGVKTTTDSYRSIDVRRWVRESFLEPGRRFSWQWSIDGEKVASIVVQAEQGQVRLIHRSRDYGDDWENLDYPVRLLSQPCHYGGYRQWFACPASGCGRRVAKLYGGRIFAFRHCYDVAYPSQRETDYQRCQRRADKIRARLGWQSDFDSHFGPKPKAMHWQTYERLVTELEEYEQASDKAFSVYFMQRFGRLA